MARMLVLACGNTLRGDDGVAFRIASALKDESIASELEIILTHQLLPEHAELLSRTNSALFLDCSAIAQPGIVSIHILSPSQSLPRIFTHHLDPASLLKLTQDFCGRIPSRAVALTIGGQSFELNEELSEPVTAAIPIALEAILHAYRNAEQSTGDCAPESGLQPSHSFSPLNRESLR